MCIPRNTSLTLQYPEDIPLIVHRCLRDYMTALKRERLRLKIDGSE